MVLKTLKSTLIKGYENIRETHPWLGHLFLGLVLCLLLQNQIFVNVMEKYHGQRNTG